MKKYLLILSLVLGALLPVSARDCGQNLSNFENRYRVTCRILNVRNAPESGRVLFTLSNGDYVYGTPQSDNRWLKVSGSEWYVSMQYLAIETNPYYMQPKTVDDNEMDMTKTLRIQRIVRWCLLGLCIIAFIILLVWSGEFIGDLFATSMDNVVVVRNGETPTLVTMHQKFYFGISSYLAVLLITALIVGSMLAGVIAMTVIGGVAWLVMALVYVVLWALVIVGWIALVGGILGVVFSDERGVSLVAAILGGVIVGWREAISTFGEAALDTGFSFFRNLYIVDFARDLCVIYWKPALFIAVAPLALFLGFAILNMLVAGISIFIENLVMRYYSIKNPCPICHHSSEPAIYLSNGVELPVRLHPGKYGLFHIVHPETKQRMPTMLFNGKDKLERKCHHCGAVISANMGTEKHVALAGVAESGKTTLTYRFIAELFRKYPSMAHFTDVADPNMVSFVKHIVETGSMKDFPDKTPIGVMRSIQLLINRKNEKIAYRLFLNDVGGELYNMVGVDRDSARQIAQFVRTVESVLFLIDPMTTDFSDCDLSSRFAAWIKKHQSDHIEKTNITDAFRRLKQLFEGQKISKKRLNKIHFNVVLVKRDLGYLSAVDTEDESALKAFVQEDMGLQALVSEIEATFGVERLHFTSVSAARDGANVEFDPFMMRIVNQLGIDLQ